MEYVPYIDNKILRFNKLNGLKKIIHINQHKIRSNSKNGSREPVITCKTYRSNSYGHEVLIFDSEGRVSAKVVYSPDKPLSCGARVWIETDNDVEVVDKNSSEVCKI